MSEDVLDAAARATIAHLRAAGAMLVTAESCTGGLIAGAVTEIPGSSDVLHGGYVTYANAAKTGMIGVPAALIATHGAVSREVAQAMARGALARSDATVAIAVTGVAGPGGGSPEKPVGTVWFGLATASSGHEERQVFVGDRHAIRRATVLHALQLVRDRGILD